MLKQKYKLRIKTTRDDNMPLKYSTIESNALSMRS